MRMTARKSSLIARHQKGASLIEILISILILSIGLFGMAGMATVASGNNKLAQIRSTANLLVADYADRARANLAAFDTGDYAMTTAYAFPTGLTAETGCTNASTNACNPTTMASADQIQWRNTAMRRLAGGNGFVTTSFQPTTNLRTMDMWIMWAEAETTSEFGLGNVYLCPAAAAAPASVKCLYFRIAL